MGIGEGSEDFEDLGEFSPFCLSHVNSGAGRWARSRDRSGVESPRLAC